MFDEMACHNKIKKAAHVVSLWSPWWIRYINAAHFTYDDTVEKITGLSTMVFHCNGYYIEKSPIMDIAVSLEYALQQSLREMDKRCRKMIVENPYVHSDLIGLAQSLEINSDMSMKFSYITPVRWSKIISKKVDSSFVHHYDISSPPELPQGSWVPKDFHFEDGLTAEKYLKMLIDKDTQAERQWMENHDSHSDETNASQNSDDSKNSDSDGDTKDDLTQQVDNEKQDSYRSSSPNDEYSVNSDNNSSPSNDVQESTKQEKDSAQDGLQDAE